MCGNAKHRQIGLTVAHSNCGGLRSQHPVAQRHQACTLVDVLGHDGGVDRGVVKREPIQPQARHQIIHDECRQGGWGTISNTERANRHQEALEQTGRSLVHESPDGILMAIIEEYPRKLLQLHFEFVELAHSLGVDKNLPTLSHGVPQIGTVFRHASSQPVGLTVVPYFGDRASGIYGHAKSIGGEQRKGLDAGRRRARISK